MSFATTAGILSCFFCTRIIMTSLFHELDVIIRAASGLLAGSAVHFAAPPTLLNERRRHHRIDDPSITAAFTLLFLYGCFEIVVARHIIWGIFPFLGWTISFVLHSSSHTGTHRTTVESRSRRDDSMAFATREARRLRNDPRTDINGYGASDL